MKRSLAIILFFICLFSIAYSELSATPTDLIELDDDDWGEITIVFERKVYLTIDKEPKYIGDIMVLTAVLVNFKEDDKYTIYWQHSTDMENWITLNGENEQTLIITITQENCRSWWRVCIQLEE